MKKVLSTLKNIGQSILIILRSRTVQSCIAGLLVHVAIKRGWIPDTFLTSAVESVAFMIAAFFRVVSTKNIDPTTPDSVLQQLPPATTPEPVPSELPQ